MNDAQKKMKRYTRAIERHLNLPKDIKTRVMSDLLSSIEARREAGKTDEEIYSELGDAKKVAAELNEQMKEFAYRKSPWRFLFGAVAAYGAAELLGSLVALILFSSAISDMEAASVGIIGGADGPTAVFVTTPGWTGYVVPVVLMTAGIWGFFRLRKCKQKEK